MTSEYRPVGVPFLRSKNIEEYRLNLDDLKFIDQEFHQKLSKSALYPGDVVVVRTGDPGTCAVIPESVPEANCADLVIIRPSERVNPRFLAYAINSVVQHKVNSKLVGTVQQHFNVTDAKNTKIPLPRREVQDKLVEFIRPLDDRIDLNNSMNRTLDAFAKALFRSWFVDFDPVVAKSDGRSPFGMDAGTTELFPSHFVDSEMGYIPEGWSVSRLGDKLVKLESGKRPKGGVSEIESGVPSLGAGDIGRLGVFDYSDVSYVPEDFFESMTRGIVQKTDVLLYKDGANLGRSTYFDDGFPYEKCCVNSHVFILRTDADSFQRYLYFWLQQPWMQEEIMARNSSSAQPGINQRSVKSLPLLIPPEEVVDAFDRIVNPMLLKIFQNSHENRYLGELRNTLIPRLVGDADGSRKLTRLVVGDP